MLYTELTKKAIRIMFDAHKDQVDKSGLPYVFHPFIVANNLDDEYSIVVALLHDVVEDTEITFVDLEKEFPKDDSEDYFEYVNKIKTNPIAKKVKISDLTHNSDLSRMDEITEYDLKRQEKYKRALEILKGEN